MVGTCAERRAGEQQARERGRGLPQHQARVREHVPVLARHAAHADRAQRRAQVQLRAARTMRLWLPSLHPCRPSSRACDHRKSKHLTSLPQHATGRSGTALQTCRAPKGRPQVHPHGCGYKSTRAGPDAGDGDHIIRRGPRTSSSTSSGAPASNRAPRLSPPASPSPPPPRPSAAPASHSAASGAAPAAPSAAPRAGPSAAPRSRAPHAAAAGPPASLQREAGAVALAVCRAGAPAQPCCAAGWGRASSGGRSGARPPRVACPGTWPRAAASQQAPAWPAAPAAASPAAGRPAPGSPDPVQPHGTGCSRPPTPRCPGTAPSGLWPAQRSPLAHGSAPACAQSGGPRSVKAACTQRRSMASARARFSTRSSRVATASQAKPSASNSARRPSWAPSGLQELIRFRDKPVIVTGARKAVTDGDTGDTGGGSHGRPCGTLAAAMSQPYAVSVAPGPRADRGVDGQQRRRHSPTLYQARSARTRASAHLGEVERARAVAAHMEIACQALRVPPAAQPLLPLATA